ncbi:hypothetical protein GKE82_00330 [Conexibacter sp. W3-3-2]|uniref:DUF4267 domain-containing protein n=1 Tax=Paraconexibacter algicola TaxID=2133960 RepID=A0A2T4UER7_9ACTN|nr:MULTISPECIES: hypothetical protein [Solirubrobacterales]MTD42790.1 hypothetical protein [Conexibacter sp. W3-3-2]PTL56274.1 hypothetical protein C7Y72_14955 [Paraconexibacter algicola]
MALSPKTLARGIAAGRLALGLAMVAAPGRATGAWLGDVADTPGGHVAVRALGIRDAILGAITLHTLEHPEVGPRWVATCGVADLVDCAATVAARDGLPRQYPAMIAVAGGAAAASFALAGALKRA